MTEAELLEVAQMGWGNVISLTTLFITILSGYLITAYVAGARMKREQVVIINLLYILMTGLVLSAIIVMTLRATEWGRLSLELSNVRSKGPADWTSWGVATTCGFSVLASLKFMWDVRHPKSE